MDEKSIDKNSAGELLKVENAKKKKVKKVSAKGGNVKTGQKASLESSIKKRNGGTNAIVEKNDMTDKKLVKILAKKAEGYTVEEEVVEYDGEGEITKRKVSTKYYPPDLAALKMYMEIAEKSDDIENMTTEELLALRKKLLEEFYENSIKEEMVGERQMRNGRLSECIDSGDNL